MVCEEQKRKKAYVYWFRSNVLLMFTSHSGKERFRLSAPTVYAAHGSSCLGHFTPLQLDALICSLNPLHSSAAYVHFNATHCPRTQFPEMIIKYFKIFLEEIRDSAWKLRSCPNVLVHIHMNVKFVKAGSSKFTRAHESFITSRTKTTCCSWSTRHKDDGIYSKHETCLFFGMFSPSVIWFPVVQSSWKFSKQ